MSNPVSGTRSAQIAEIRARHEARTSGNSSAQAAAAGSETFGGKVVRVLKEAGQAFCNLMSSLWNKITSFISDNAPTDREARVMARNTGRSICDAWRSVKHSVSDFFCPPSAATRMGRGIGNAGRCMGRGIADFADVAG